MPTVLITAGGTVEPIDGVRGITNFSSGRLGSLLAQLFLARGWDVIFLRGKSTATLGNKGTRLREVACTDTASVAKALEAEAATNRVDAVIHSMAISDYTVAGVNSVDSILAILRQSDVLSLAEVEAVLSSTSREKQGKVSSTIKHPLLLLEQTPKLINGLRALFPDAVLVGFKLLNGASETALRDAACQSVEKNRLDFVVANDLTSIRGESHTATLYGSGQFPLGSASTKSSITDMVFSAVATLAERRRGVEVGTYQNVAQTGKRVLLIVTGSIAAYKAVDIANSLRGQGHSVKVVLTEAAKRFIPVITFKGQGFETYTDEDEWAWAQPGVLHIELARNWADTVLVAPATANTLAKMRTGLTDNLATSCLRAFTGRVVVAPAMNTGMYENSAEIISALAERGVQFVNPVAKRLACGEIGNGGLAPTTDIVQGALSS